MIKKNGIELVLLKIYGNPLKRLFRPLTPRSRPQDVDEGNKSCAN